MIFGGGAGNTIAKRVGNLSDTDPWEWSCGLRLCRTAAQHLGIFRAFLFRFMSFTDANIV
jgi:hypothetical protein